jgi:hypothetical protein
MTKVRNECDGFELIVDQSCQQHVSDSTDHGIWSMLVIENVVLERLKDSDDSIWS